MLNMKKLILIFLFWIGLVINAKAGNKFNTVDYIHALKQVTDVMVNDVTSPVAAGRYYAYITLTASETALQFAKENTFSFASKLNGFNGVVINQQTVKQADYSFSVIFSLYKISERLLPSGYLMTKYLDSLSAIALQKGITPGEIEKSRQLVNDIITQIIDYVKKDHFSQLSGLKKYTPLPGDANWRPTAPGYMAALEPYWNTLRTFILDSAKQFIPAPAVAFDTLPASAFYRQMKGVYQTAKKLTAKQKAIADFWDCNPFALQQIGHVEFGLKKISPGGHWIGITGIACKQANKGLLQTVFIHTVIAVTIADAFISCWDEKYRSNRIRPVTAIKKWINPYWKPYLQTPPFPEYTSGHSVISTAAAIVLTKIFGNKFTYTDNTENEFGIPSRKFTSFLQAAGEAAISRFYGGIHYKDAIENGTVQGKQIGLFAVVKFKDILGRKILKEKKIR